MLNNEKLWSNERSVKLTHLMVRLFYVVLAAVTAGAVTRLTYNFEWIWLYFVPFFISVPAGFAALVCLDKLLINIKKQIVFDESNVKLLRIFSWLCFCVCLVTLFFIAIVFIRAQADGFGTTLNLFDAVYMVFALCVSVAEVFVGIVVRVVKNIFEAAIKIKEENELTI